VIAELYDEQAERAVLGAIVVRNAAIDDVADVLEAEHFWRQHHQSIFRAMVQLHGQGQPIDAITLCGQLDKSGALEAVGKPYIYGLGDGVGRSVNVAAYAEVVKDKSTLRALRDLGRRVHAAAEADVAIASDLLEQAEQDIYRISQTAVKTDWSSAPEMAAEIYPLIEQLTKTGEAITGRSTGLPHLDSITRGLQPGDLILVGARPGMGKTAIAMQIALTVAANGPVAVMSLEMARVPLALRGVISLAQVNGWQLMSGRASDVDLQRMGDGIARFASTGLFVDESPVVSPIQARSKLRRLQARTGPLALVVIDYLQLMAPLPDDRRENRANQVAGISRALKIMAREFSVPFLVLSQLSRAFEKSRDKRPSMSDLRESGALEQDADVVLLLHRPEVYEKKPENAGLAELIVGKQRNGPTGSIDLTWHGPQMRFEHRGRA